MIILYVIIAIVVVILLWLLTCIIKVYQHDQAYQRINDEDWHIDGFSKPIYAFRLINAIGLGCGSSCFVYSLLYIIDKMLVQPALKKSLKMMEAAEEIEWGRVDPILCNKEARDAMKQRVQDYYSDIWRSKTMNNGSKILNYSGAYQCLTHHQALLKLGMSVEVSKEKVREPVFIVSLPRTGTTILHRTMSLDRKRFRNFDLCDMIAPLPGPVPRWDEEGRKQKAKEGNELFDKLKAIFPGFAECMETMHGFRSNEADEDLGWYDTGLGHMYMVRSSIIKLAFKIGFIFNY